MLSKLRLKIFFEAGLGFVLSSIFIPTKDELSLESNPDPRVLEATMRSSVLGTYLASAVFIQTNLVAQK